MAEGKTPARVTTTCAIAGGGPAGMMLGFLLARAGVEVTVLEKHADFLRDFRGDTVHPSTLEVMHELGLVDAFLRLPHTEMRQLVGQIGDDVVRIADFSHLPAHCRFIAIMPQWDFLNFLAEHGRRYPAFHLHMRSEVGGLIVEGDRVVGVNVRGPDGDFDVRADLVVGADGRHSTVRERAGLAVDDFGVPMDVFWMRLSRRPEDSNQALGRIVAGTVFVTIDRGDYWQCAFVIPKGGAEQVRGKGIEAFRARIAELAPLLRDRVHELASFDDVKLLTVTVDRLRQWYRSGLLCIGDAAHAMSPLGGVGINLAIQDAVAAANILAAPLGEKRATTADLARVQSRREFPMRVTQRLQLLMQNRVIRRVLTSTEKPVLPWAVRLLDRCPLLQRIPARLVGLGVRPEHVRTPEVAGSVHA